MYKPWTRVRISSKFRGGQLEFLAGTWMMLVWAPPIAQGQDTGIIPDSFLTLIPASPDCPCCVQTLNPAHCSILRQCWSSPEVLIQSVGSGARLPRFTSQLCHLLGGWPPGTYLASLGINFLICQMEILRRVEVTTESFDTWKAVRL